MKAKECIYDMNFPHLLCSFSEMFSVFSTLYVLYFLGAACLVASCTPWEVTIHRTMYLVLTTIITTLRQNLI